MSQYRTLDAVTVEYFSQHPEEIEACLDEAFADYAQDGDSAALLTTLRIVARAKGISYAEVGMNSLDNVNLIMRAMGYQLRPQRLENGAV